MENHTGSNSHQDKHEYTTLQQRESNDLTVVTSESRDECLSKNEIDDKRGTWAKELDFILACVGWAVGLGNIWRFPYLCYKNGGGAFLIPYFLSVVTCGVPVFFLEIALGQYMKRGSIGAWNITPAFKGIGVATFSICIFMNIYYIIVLTWAAFYLYMSCTSTLPWSSCDNYWNSDRRRVLQRSAGIDEPGGLQLELVLSLALVWILVYFCVWRGVRWTGKVWIDGGTQIFFSYAIGVGALITLGSYNKFNNNFYRDCIIVSCINTGTSLLGGFVVFSVLGFMAHEQGTAISEVAEAGPGLVFIVYPKALTQMPIPTLWSILFFIMVVVVGLDSQFVAVEGLLTPILDMFPKKLYNMKNRMLVTAFYCVLTFLAGLAMVTRGGIYIFQLFDYYSASGFVLLWVCFFEVVTVSWVFGIDRFMDVIELMIGRRIPIWFGLCWRYITPLISTGIFLFMLSDFKPLTYNIVYEYPLLAQLLGASMALISMICIPVVFCVQFFKYPGNLKEKWRSSTAPVLRVFQLPTGWDLRNVRVINK